MCITFYTPYVHSIHPMCITVHSIHLDTVQPYPHVASQYIQYTQSCIIINGCLVITNGYHDLLALRIALRSLSDDKTADCGDTCLGARTLACAHASARLPCPTDAQTGAHAHPCAPTHTHTHTHTHFARSEGSNLARNHVAVSDNKHTPAPRPIFCKLRLRGNHLSNTTCLTHVFFKRGE